MRLDVLGLQRRLPRPIIEWAFGMLAKRVRRSVAQGDGVPDVCEDDFPVGAPSDDDIDLLAVCTRPRAGDPTSPRRSGA